jgi:hypothetical protein
MWRQFPCPFPEATLTFEVMLMLLPQRQVLLQLRNPPLKLPLGRLCSLNGPLTPLTPEGKGLRIRWLGGKESDVGGLMIRPPPSPWQAAARLDAARGRIPHGAHHLLAQTLDLSLRAREEVLP